MIYRMLPLAALALAVFIAAPAQAAKAADEATHDGKVVSITGDKIVMTGKDGKEHTHTLAESAKVTCDGKDCKLSELKPGMKIRVNTSKDDKKVATRIEALDKNEDFEKRDK
jgi:hypothetical protein